MLALNIIPKILLHIRYKIYQFKNNLLLTFNYLSKTLKFLNNVAQGRSTPSGEIQKRVEDLYYVLKGYARNFIMNFYSKPFLIFEVSDLIVFIR
jgi:hypothetical protein